MDELVRHRTDMGDWHVFFAVAIHRSLNGAARALRVDPSTVTRTLDQLEGRLNAKLVRRGPQGVTLTAEGEATLVRVRTMEHMMADLERAIADGQSVIPEGHVGISAPDGVAAYFVGPALPKLLQENPKLSVGLDCGLWAENPLRGEAEIFLTFDEPNQSDTVARELAHFHYALFASQRFLDLYGRPSSLQEMLLHPYVHHSAQVRSGGMKRAVPAFQELASRRVETNSSAALLETVKAGVGIGAFPTAMVAREPDMVMIGPSQAPVTLWLAHHRESARIPRIQVTLDWLAEIFDPQKKPWFRPEFVSPDDFRHLIPAPAAPAIAPEQAPTRKDADRA